MSANPIPPAVWGSHNIQLVAFPVVPVVGMNQEWFAAVTGESPDTTKNRLRREDQAEVGGRLISLVSEIGKITWAEQAIVKVDDPPQEMPATGPFDVSRNRFSTLIESWWQHCPPIWRLAFACKIVIPTNGREESYELLSKYLAGRVNIDAKNSSDFIYRINRPRVSAVLKGRKINRLSTWTAFRIEMSLRTSATLDDSPALRHSVNSCCAELDINTTPDDKGPIPPDLLPLLWNELVEMGAEIAEKGDVQ